MTSLAELCSRALAGDPARPAIEFGGRWHDWGAVRRLAAEVGALLTDAGIGDAAGVCLVPRNRPSALAALVGLLADGRSVTMAYPFQPAAAIAAAVGRATAAATILAEEDATPEVLAAIAANGMAAIALADSASGAMSARLLPGLDRGTARADAGPPRIEVLTSGTTGPPKSFPIPHAVVAGFVQGQGLSLLDDPDAPPFLMSFPIGNITGIYSIAASLLRGGRVVLLDRFSVEGWHDFVRRYRPRVGGAPPAAVAMLVDADLPREDLASLRSFGTGAAPLDPAVQRRFEEKYGIPILLSYGATEFGGPVAAMTPQLRADWGDAKPGSVGRAMAGVRLRVRDEGSGAILGPGDEGLLEVVSPRMGPDWIRTADVATIDADGFLFIRGRADGAIRRGGFKILPEAIERVLLLHPSVSTAAVVAVADARLYEVPGAVVVPRAGLPPPDPDSLATLIREHLPATHVPAHWRFVDALPTNPSFKVDRPALKRLFGDAMPA